MIRDMEAEWVGELVIDIITTDGDYYKAKDFPDQDFNGEDPIMFWIGDKIGLIPMHQVKQFTLYKEEKNND